VLAGTLIGCLVLHEFVIRRLTILRPLFGLSVDSSAKERSNRRFAFKMPMKKGAKKRAKKGAHSESLPDSGG